MIAGRCQRPFSLDQKIADLDQHLPPHRKVVEVRLLAVAPKHRKQAVFTRLAGVLARHFRAAGCDLAIISGTLRQIPLYAHLGFEPFGQTVGSSDAPYQPMCMTLIRFQSQSRSLLIQAGGRPVSLLPGPVEIASCVTAALHTPALYHRDPRFDVLLKRVRDGLSALTQSSDVVLMSGSGTLANDAIAAQLAAEGAAGIVLSNGEFGERLADHARRWRLNFQTVSSSWGSPLDLVRLEEHLNNEKIGWVWAAACETSTGTHNATEALKRLCRAHKVDLCLDAVSAVGMQPCDLSGVRLASAVSGKALGAYSGLAMIFHDGRLDRSGCLPRYLDLASYEDNAGVPFTQSSNLLAALDASLQNTDWPLRWRRIRDADAALQDGLQDAGFQIVGSRERMPGIVTLAIPTEISASLLAKSMTRFGYLLAGHSNYLRERNWLQICLMGQWQDDLLEVLPKQLARQVKLAEPLKV
jgi:aspartate aminotransferase-like enzyme